MKFIPNAIARKVAVSALQTKMHSPTILFGSGVVGMVGSTVLACRATLKLNELLDDIDRERYQAIAMKKMVDEGTTVEGQTYSNQEFKRDLASITVRGLGSVGKLYAPSVLLGVASVGCLTRSHNILQERNLALTAAYATLDEAFKSYRSRVIEKYGEEEDRDIRRSYEMVETRDEEGTLLELTPVGVSGEGVYARYFDTTNPNWTNPPEYSFLFLRAQQNSFTDLLRMRGHVFLNEVYDNLGLSHTEQGAVVGWVWDPDNELRRKEPGDNYIDFGLQNDEEDLLRFINGVDQAILLDFNVDGVIYDLLNKIKKGNHPWRR